MVLASCWWYLEFSIQTARYFSCYLASSRPRACKKNKRKQQNDTCNTCKNGETKFDSMLQHRVLFPTGRWDPALLPAHHAEKRHTHAYMLKVGSSPAHRFNPQHIAFVEHRPNPPAMGKEGICVTVRDRVTRTAWCGGRSLYPFVVHILILYY